MERVTFFLDYANINRAASELGHQLDYADLLGYIAEGRFLIDAYCYIPLDPRNEHRLDNEIEKLWQAGYNVTTKVGTIAGDSYKCNLDIEIAMDVTKIVYQVKPDIVVLATGDGDFVPLIQQLRQFGIRVEVASFKSSAAREIILKCSGFIDLDVYLDEYLDQFREEQKQQIHVEDQITGEPIEQNASQNISQNRTGDNLNIPHVDDIG